MLNLNICNKAELNTFKKKELIALVLASQSTAENEYKRAVFWEKDARGKDRDATNANTTVLSFKIKALKEEIKNNEDKRIVDIMTVRSEWTKSEDKHREAIKELKMNLKDERAINQRLGRDRDYWKDAHQIIKEDKNHDAWMHDKDVIKLQKKIIRLLEQK